MTMLMVMVMMMKVIVVMVMMVLTLMGALRILRLVFRVPPWLGSIGKSPFSPSKVTFFYLQLICLEKFRIVIFAIWSCFL